MRAELDEAFGAGEPEVRASHAVIVVDADAESTQLAARAPSRAARDERGQSIEIYKEAGLPRDFVERFELDDDQRQPRARPHPHGHRERGDHRRLAPVLDRARPLPRAQRLALQPQPAARAPAARGHRVPDRERLRGGRRLPHLAAARGRQPRDQALESCLEELDGFYTFAVGTADGFAVLRDPIACKPAVMAETRRLGGDGLRVPRDRGAARRRGRDACGSPSRRSSTAGRGSRPDGDVPEQVTSRSWTSTHTRCASSTAALHDRGRDAAAAALAGARTRAGPARDRRGAGRGRRGRRRRPRGLLLRRHEQAARRCACTATAGVGLAENIMSGTVVVDGNASQSAGATGRGGLVVVHGRRRRRAAGSR